MLTLREACQTRRLREFIAQEEARGIGPANEPNVGRVLELLIKSH